MLDWWLIRRLAEDYSIRDIILIGFVLLILFAVYLVAVDHIPFLSGRLSQHSSISVAAAGTEARTAIGKINNSINWFYGEFEYYPESVEEMTDARLLDLKDRVLERWQFEFEGEDEIEYIWAYGINMPEDLQIVIRYDRDKHDFDDYQSKDFARFTRYGRNW